MAEAEPFPIEALGPLIADAVGAVTETLQCPVEIVAQSYLAVAALAVQGHYDAAHPAGGAVPCSLALMTIAESGERKSSADREALRPVVELEEERRLAFRSEYAQWKASCDAREALRRAAKSKKAKKSVEEIAAELEKIGEDSPPPVPAPQVFSEPNYEGLLRAAPEMSGSLLWANNEAGQSIGGTAFANENKLKFASGLSKFWDGQNIDIIRSGAGALVLRRRRLTTHLMLQPAIAAGFLGDCALQNQGWFSRVLVCNPRSRIGNRPFKNRPANFSERVDPFQMRSKELLARPLHSTSGTRNELTPKPLPWSSDAHEVWRAFHDEIEGHMADGGSLAEHRGFGAKLAENVFRIATVLQVFNAEGVGEVTRQTMLDAIKIGRYFLTETLRMSAELRVSEDLRLAELTRAILADPQRWPDEFACLSALMQRGPSGVRNKDMASRVMNILVEHGHLTKDAEDAVVWGRSTKKAHRILGRGQSTSH